MRLLLVCVAFALTAAGCGSPRPVTGTDRAPVSAMSDVPLGEVFELERGTSVLVEGHRLSFASVREDSRCPWGTTCVWAGRAVVAFSFVGTNAIGEMALELPGGATAETEPRPEQSAMHGGYRFTILALNPYPGTDEAEANETAVATIRVDPAGG